MMYLGAVPILAFKITHSTIALKVEVVRATTCFLRYYSLF